MEKFTPDDHSFLSLIRCCLADFLHPRKTNNRFDTPYSSATIFLDERVREKMTYQLFEEVVLLEDVIEKGLMKGDVATIVDHHPGPDGEDGYTLELFNVLGDTIAVITLSESAIAPLTENEIFSVRSLAR